MGGKYFCDLLLNSFMLKGLISCKVPRLRITEHVDINDTTNLPNITGDGLWIDEWEYCLQSWVKLMTQKVLNCWFIAILGMILWQWNRNFHLHNRNRNCQLHCSNRNCHIHCWKRKSNHRNYQYNAMYDI